MDVCQRDLPTDFPVKAPGDERLAETEFWLEDVCPNMTFARYRLRLLTGRTHQLRLGLAELGAPILGDELYALQKQFGSLRGTFAKSPSIALQSFKLKMNKKICIELPLPEDPIWTRFEVPADMHKHYPL